VAGIVAILGYECVVTVEASEVTSGVDDYSYILTDLRKAHLLLREFIPVF